MLDYSQWRVLVVDDEPDNIGVVTLVLDFNEIPYWTAESGEACLALLPTIDPNLVLLDIRMPKKDGFEVLSALRSDVRWKDLIVVALTAYALEGDAQRMLAAGFDGYISKPVSTQTLLDELVSIVSARVNDV